MCPSQTPQLPTYMTASRLYRPPGPTDHRVSRASPGTNPPGRTNGRDGPYVSSARVCWAMMCTTTIFQVFVTELRAAATFFPASHVLGITFDLFVADWLFTFPQACCSATGELVNLSPLKVDILTISPLAEQLFPLSDLSVSRI